MNRITAFSVFLVFVYGALLLTFKIMGYTIAAIFAQPSQFYLLVLPLGIITFVFQVTLIYIFKPRTKIEKAFKLLSLFTTVLIVPMIVSLPWTYIVFGTKLQLLLIFTIIFCLVMQILLNWIKNKTSIEK